MNITLQKEQYKQKKQNPGFLKEEKSDRFSDYIRSQFNYPRKQQEKRKIYQNADTNLKPQKIPSNKNTKLAEIKQNYQA